MAPSVNNITCKTVIVGDSGVGKTSLMYRFCRGHYTTHNSTIGKMKNRKKTSISLRSLYNMYMHSEINSEYIATIN